MVLANSATDYVVISSYSVASDMTLEIIQGAKVTDARYIAELQEHGTLTKN